MNRNLSSIEQLVDFVTPKSLYEEILRNASEKYNIEHLCLENISPQIILQNISNVEKVMELTQKEKDEEEEP